MLYLNPPFHMIEGVVCFPDHADPLQFYYLPLGPRISEQVDKNGRRSPKLQLIAYKGRAGTGGFLNFDVDLGIDQERLEEVERQLQAKQRLRARPRLGPVPLVDGSVRLLLFGKQTGDAPTTGAATGAQPEFVLKIDQPAKPALYGENRATFSVSLDEAGVVLLKRALQGEMSPIGVVYSLDYLALRPAYNVQLTIDWDRVQKHFEESFGVNTLVFSTSIDKAIDELIESRAIVLTADTFVPDGSEDVGVIGRRDQALAELREMMTNTFFTSSIEPHNTKKDDWDKVGDMLTRITTAGAYGADGLFNFKKVDYTRIDKKTMNVEMRERTTVKRTVYPQGHLSGLMRPLLEQGRKLEDFVVEADLDDDWFKRRRVEVLSIADFEQDSIRSINVALQYGNQTKNALLDASRDRAEVDFTSMLSAGAMKREVTASYTVTFQNVDSSERPVTLKSPKQVFSTDVVEVVPRSLYSLVSVPIVVNALVEDQERTLWDRYPKIEVRTRYVDEKNKINVDDNFLLDRDADTALWRLFVMDPAKTQFRYQVVYHAIDHKDVTTPWMETSEERIVLGDPFPTKRKVHVVPAVSWEEVDRIFVELSYEDARNGIRREQVLEFTEPASRIFQVDMADPAQRAVTYRVTILFRNGVVREIPRSRTLQEVVFIRSEMKGHKIVRVAPRPPTTFATKKLREMVVSLRNRDTVAGEFAERLIWTSHTDQGFFEYDYAEEAKAGLDYSVTYKFTNGLSRSVPWTEARGDELLLPVG